MCLWPKQDTDRLDFLSYSPQILPWEEGSRERDQQATVQGTGNGAEGPVRGPPKSQGLIVRKSQLLDICQAGSLEPVLRGASSSQNCLSPLLPSPPQGWELGVWADTRNGRGQGYPQRVKLREQIQATSEFCLISWTVHSNVLIKTDT